MCNRPFPLGSHWPVSERASEPPTEPSKPYPSSLPPLPQDHADSREVKLAMNEPKRRLIRDARVLCQQRKITQGQMAEELGISKRTLEEWMQFRRMPQAPSEALLRIWMERQTP